MSERHVWLALGLSCSLVLSACGGGLHGRVYRLPRACRGATEPDEVRRCAGRLLDDSIVARLGVYDDRELLAYVRRVGLRVARPSQRPADSWTFRILEDSGVGAWAAPDAHIYITRGLLAALDSEAELAAVLGHEVGHVVSGHTDTALDKLPELASGDWSSQFRLSRDDEAQADQLSVRYLRAAGYDPRAIRSALRTVYRVGGPEASYRRRHPPLTVRLALTARVADGATEGRLARDRYLRHLEGLVVGRDPRRGRVAEGRYVHDLGGFSFALPEGFHAQTSTGLADFSAQGPDENLGISLIHLSSGGDSLLSRAFREGLAADSVRRFRLAGYQAVRGTVAASSTTAEPHVARAVVFAAKNHHSFALIVNAPAPYEADVDATLRQLLGSFRRETGRASPLRLRIRRVAHATTLAALITTGCAPSGQEADLVALNGIALDAPIEATRRVKCIAR